MITADERFDSKVDRSAGPDACWPWAGGLTRLNGYGQIRVGGRRIGVHRYALQRSLGRDLAQDECALHECDNPPCVNPAHLRVGTRADNTADMMTKGRHVAPFASGAGNPMAKLTVATVREIRNTYAKGGMSQRQIAAHFGISQSQVSYVVNGKGWTL